MSNHLQIIFIFALFLFIGCSSDSIVGEMSLDAGDAVSDSAAFDGANCAIGEAWSEDGKCTPVKCLTHPTICQPDEEQKFYAFITSSRYRADEVGGIEGADARCRAAATNGGYGGKFIAWISTPKVNAIDRMPAGVSWYLKSDYYKTEELLFKSKATIVADPLLDRVYDEMGRHECGASTPDLVWTATGRDGKFMPGSDTSFTACTEWTVAENAQGVIAGSPCIRSRWSNYGEISCDARNFARLYCFQIE